MCPVTAVFPMSKRKIKDPKKRSQFYSNTMEKDQAQFTKLQFNENHIQRIIIVLQQRIDRLTKQIRQNEDTNIVLQNLKTKLNIWKDVTPITNDLNHDESLFIPCTCAICEITKEIQ